MDASRVIVALDVPSAPEAMKVVNALGSRAQIYKVGAQLFTAAGPRICQALVKRGKEVFLDLKFHDIPTSVAAAVRAAADFGASMVTVHAAGGPAMLGAAREAAGEGGPAILAVTLLTSLRAAEVEQVFGRSPVSLVDEVVRLAGLAVEAGIFGVIASVSEVKGIRRRYGDALKVVTPGIRLAGETPGDQARYATPADAARAGADYIVVGRSILGAGDPAAAFDAVLASFGPSPISG
ncbi:MAG: orotidine-5'-phosphate decarboxylase [Gemmatimonadetes bacterium]|nr:orotidine-5'-phosphate decarboxylase [Gemmatimonadota bacterium]